MIKYIYSEFLGNRLIVLLKKNLSKDENIFFNLTNEIFIIHLFFLNTGHLLSLYLLTKNPYESLKK